MKIPAQIPGLRQRSIGSILLPWLMRWNLGCETHETRMHVLGSPILKFVKDISDMSLQIWNP